MPRYLTPSNTYDRSAILRAAWAKARQEVVIASKPCWPFPARPITLRAAFAANRGDQVFEKPGEGFDRVLARSDYALPLGQAIEGLYADATGSTAGIGLTGNEFANVLQGSAGPDRLDGGGGADQMYGYGGDDIYTVDNAADQVFEAVGAGFDRVLATTTYSLTAGQSIEGLYANYTSSTAAIDLTGNEIANRLEGSAGANKLDGGAGADTMVGYGGDDIYTVDNPGDQVIEAVGGGFDRVLARTDYTLQAGQEIGGLYADATHGTTPLYLTGNEFGQTLIGNDGANRLNGGGNADTLMGGGGDDTFMLRVSPVPSNLVHVVDFSPSTPSSHNDTIELNHEAYPALGLGSLPAGAFQDLSIGSETASTRITYTPGSGSLGYDPDGAGGNAPMQFAILDNHAAITSIDFKIV